MPEFATKPKSLRTRLGAATSKNDSSVLKTVKVCVRLERYEPDTLRKVPLKAESASERNKDIPTHLNRGLIDPEANSISTKAQTSREFPRLSDEVGSGSTQVETNRFPTRSPSPVAECEATQRDTTEVINQRGIEDSEPNAALLNTAQPGPTRQVPNSGLTSKEANKQLSLPKKALPQTPDEVTSTTFSGTNPSTSENEFSIIDSAAPAPPQRLSVVPKQVSRERVSPSHSRATSRLESVPARHDPKSTKHDPAAGNLDQKFSPARRGGQNMSGSSHTSRAAKGSTSPLQETSETYSAVLNTLFDKGLSHILFNSEINECITKSCRQIDANYQYPDAFFTSNPHSAARCDCCVHLVL